MTTHFVDASMPRPPTTAPVEDELARYGPGATHVERAPYSPFAGGGPPSVPPAWMQKPPGAAGHKARTWWIVAGAVAGIVALVALVSALVGGGGGGSGGGGTSRDKLVERALAALADDDLDKLVAVSLPADLRIDNCKSQDAAAIRTRMRNSHRESLRRLRRWMNRTRVDQVKIALLAVEEDPDPSRYRKGSPALGAGTEECEYTRELAVHRLRADVRINGDTEDVMRIAAIELDGKWYLADFLLGGTVMSDRPDDPY